MTAPVRDYLPPRQRVLAAATAAVDADSEDDEAYARAMDNLRKATDRWHGARRARQAGLASARALTPEQRRERASKAAAARWRKIPRSTGC